MELNKCYNMDCMEGMAKFPDGFFDLAVVDPPYGIQRLKRKQSRLAKYGDPTQANNDVPGPDYWRELFRVSRRQIVWGGNYFDLPPCRTPGTHTRAHMKNLKKNKARRRISGLYGIVT